MKESNNHPTRWKPGQSGNPRGRPGKASEFRNELRKMGPKALKAIKAGIEAGDAACLKIWADRCDPANKATMQTVEFIADTTDLTQFSMSVLVAISKGEVPPDVGNQIINAAANAARVADIDEIRREMAELLQMVEEIKNDNP